MSKRKKYNSKHAGILIDADRCLITVSDGIETIGLPAHDVNNAVDYCIYRLLGAQWRKENSTVITIQSLISDDFLEVTGYEYDQWFNKKEIREHGLKENARIRRFWDKVGKAYKKTKAA